MDKYLLKLQKFLLQVSLFIVFAIIFSSQTKVFAQDKKLDTIVNTTLVQPSIIKINKDIQGSTRIKVGAKNIVEAPSTIYGDLYISGGILDLNGQHLIVKGNLIHEGGTLDINGGTLDVSGDYRIQKEYRDNNGTIRYSEGSYGTLKMINENDSVKVGGSFYNYTRSSHEGYLTAGMLEVKGDIELFVYNYYTYDISQYGFATSGTHKVVLNGTSAQRIRVIGQQTQQYSHFNILELSNNSSEGIEFENPIIVNKELKRAGTPIKNSRNIYLAGTALVEGGVWKEEISIGGTWTSQNDIIFEQNVYIDTNEKVSFNGKNIRIRGDLHIKQTQLDLGSGSISLAGNMYSTGYINLNGKSLELPKNLYLDGGIIDLSKSTLKINGSLVHSDGEININSGTLDVVRDYRIQKEYKDSNGTIRYGEGSNGILRMMNENDSVKVGGSFYNYTGRSHEGHLTAGTLEVKGDIELFVYNYYTYYVSQYGFATSGTHKVVLNGTSAQKVRVFGQQTQQYSHFNILEISNSSVEGIEFENPVVVNKELKRAATPIKNSKNIYLAGTAVVYGGVWKDEICVTGTWTAQNDITFEKNVYIDSNEKVSFNGKNIRFRGDLHVKGAEIDLSNGSISIAGNMYSTGYITLNGKSQVLPKSLYINGGILNLNGNSLRIGENLVHTNGTVYINGGVLDVVGDYEINKEYENGHIIYDDGHYSVLKMIKQNDLVKIGGNFYNYSKSSHEGYLTAGTLEVKGDFELYVYNYTTYYTSLYNFAASGTHKVVLNGTSAQRVTIYGEQTKEYSHFNILEIKNNSVWGVIFKSKILVNKLFNHNRNIFTLEISSQFPDFDGDKVPDDIDSYPMDATRRDVFYGYNMDVSPDSLITTSAGNTVYYEAKVQKSMWNMQGRAVEVEDELNSSKTTLITDIYGEVEYLASVPETALPGIYKLTFQCGDATVVRLIKVNKITQGSGDAIVEGYIKGANGPLEGVSIQIGNVTETSDSSGYYKVSNIAQGKHIVTVSQTDYYTEEIEITVSGNSHTENFTLTKKSTDTNRPIIKYVFSEYSKSNDKEKYFLHDSRTKLTFGASIDWNGFVPGSLKFITPTNTYYENSFFHTFNFGKDIPPGGRLKVVAVSQSGVESEPVDAGIEIMPPPPFEIVEGESLRVSLLNNKIEYGSNITLGIPELTTDRPPDQMFLLGGQGIKFGANFNVKLSIDTDGVANLAFGTPASGPSGSKKLKETKRIIAIGGIGIEGAIGGAAIYTYNASLNEWVLDGGAIEASIEASAGITTYILVSPPVYLDGRVGASVTSTNTIKGISQGDIKYEGKISGELYGQGAVGAGAKDILCVEGSVRLTGGISIADLEFEKLVKLNGQIKVVALLYSKYWNFVDYQWPEKNVNSSNLLLKDGSSKYNSSFTTLSRDYLNEPKEWITESTIKKNLTNSDFNSQSMDNNTTNSMIALNIFPYTDHRLTTLGDKVYMVWIDDNPQRTDNNRTELKYSVLENGIWSQPMTVQNDGTADFKPVVVSVNEGLLTAWQNISETLQESEGLTETLSKSEIAVGKYDAKLGTWSDTKNLTDDNYYDHSPRLTAKDDNALLVWIKSETNDLNGSFDKQDKIQFSSYSNNLWSDAEVINQYAGDITSSSIAFNGTKGVYVYSIDGDYDISTTVDQEIYIMFYQEGKWSNPTKFTNNNVQDSNPQVSFANNNFFITWYQDGKIMYKANLETIEEPVIAVKVNDSLSSVDYKMISEQSGNISLIWGESNNNGQALFTSIYDKHKGLWSSKMELASGEYINRSPDGVYDKNNELLLVYDRVTVERKVLNGVEYFDFGTTDLYQATIKTLHDLSVLSKGIGSIPVKPVPGGTAILEAVIQNKGQFAEQDVEVDFYDGDPESGGVKIGETQVIKSPVAAGSEIIVSTSWNVPLDYKEHIIYVIVDPSNRTLDINRSNNIAFAPVIVPDIVINDIDYEKMGPSKYLVNVKAVNAGYIPVSNAIISAFSKIGDTTEIGKTTINLMEPGQVYKFSFIYDISKIDTRGKNISIFAKISTTDNINELYMQNNEYITTMNITGEYEPFKIIATNPQANKTGVSVRNRSITVIFNSKIIQGSEYDNIVLLNGNGEVVRSKISIDKNTLIITSDYDLYYSTNYTVVVPTNAISSFDNDNLSEDYKFSFTTEYEMEQLKIINTNPINGAINVSVNKSITITFNRNISLIFNASAKLKSNDIKLVGKDNKEIAISYTIEENKLIITPMESLNYDTEYKLLIPQNSIADTYQNRLITSYMFSFTTQKLSTIIIFDNHTYMN